MAAVRDNLERVSIDRFGPLGLTHDVQEQVLAITPRLLPFAPVPPAIAPDEGGVAVLYWVGGDISAEIGIGPHGIEYGLFGSAGHVTDTTDPDQTLTAATNTLSELRERILSSHATGN